MSVQPHAFDSHIHFAIADSSLGKVLVAKSDKGICSVMIGDDEQQLIAELGSQFKQQKTVESFRKTNLALQQVVSHIEKPHTNFSAALDMHGTDFQKTVWQTLKKIPHGETVTYKQLAAKIGQPEAIRAVANACGANKLAVLVPCHRVIGHDGQLTGYRWGVERKQQLLALEQANQG